VCNKTTFFKILVTLWVYGKKVQTEASVDLGAITNFVDRVVVENNNLVTHKLANLYHVINADGTPNKVGQITEYVQCYESPKKELTFCAFEHLIYNLKSYNGI